MLVQFDNVSVSVGGSVLLSQISFSVNRGVKVCITGKSGSGKSTILRTLAGIHQPSAGRLVFQDQTINAGNIGVLRSCMAYVMQRPVLGAPTAEAALMLPFTYSANNTKPAYNRVKEVLKSVNLDDSILGKRSGVLSEGEQQRLVIARALLLKKNVFLMDEATTGLDDVSKAIIIGLFKDLKATILSVSHDRQWLDMCSRRLELEDGRLIEETRAPLKNDGNV
jgi:ABC-type lipoprotein export system ATPase subunit